MTKNTRAQDLDALESLLEVYGADRTRWPARERLRFAGFISEDADARRLISEASALDRLLDCAPRASEDREHALKERIVAAALRTSEPRFAVVAAGGGQGEAHELPVWKRRPAALTSMLKRLPVRSEWPAAAVLAASLVMGVMLGSAGTFQPTMQEVAEAAGFATADSSQLAFSDDILGTDEDLL